MYKDSQLRKIQSLTIRSLESLKRFSQRRHPRRHVSFFSFSLASTHIYMHTHTHTHSRIFLCTQSTADKVEWTTIEAEVDERKKGGQVGREMTMRLSGSWTTRFISISTKGFIYVYDHTWNVRFQGSTVFIRRLAWKKSLKLQRLLFLVRIADDRLSWFQSDW